MRILHAISSLDPSAGGPPMVVSRLAAAQARLGHDVHLIAYSVPKAAAEVRTSLSKLPGADLLKFHELPPATKREWYLSTKARAKYSDLLGGTSGQPRFDALHLHGLWDPILKAGADTARRTGTPYVIAPHGMLDAWALSEKPLKKKLALALGYKSMVVRASLMHALSQYEFDCIKSHQWNGRIQIIPNGVFLEELDPLPPKGTFRSEMPALGDDPYILFLARLHPVKGLDLLVDALHSLRDKHPRWRLVVAGPDFGAQAQLEAQITRLGMGERVHLVGPLWGARKLAALADAACFSLPSKHEGFSMSIAEALACRLAVVITENCHFPEVGEVGAGVVVKRDVASIAQGLDRVMSNAAARQTMGQAGRQLIEARYTWPKVADRSVAEYAKLRPGR
ncbi:MAG: glycosyltransferase [Planctomycetota bacterium]|nr:glycosyltransferase [Planctomycetota bacterium]